MTQETAEAANEVAPKAWTRWVAPVVGVAMFVAAVLVIGEELRHIRWADVAAALGSASPWAMGAAFVGLAVSLAAASAFDALSARAIGRPVSWRDSAVTSAAAFALANAGPPGLALAGGLRFRRYAAFGLSGADTAWLSALSTAAALSGGVVLISLGAAGALQAVVAQAHMPHWVGLVLGFAGLKGLISLIAAPRIGWLARVLPPRAERAAMIAVSGVEWMGAGFILYAFLPDASVQGFLHYLPVFGLAGLLGAVSGLPGGVGAFDAIMIAVLGPRYGAAEVTAALLLYRGVYIVIPLLAAGAISALLSVEVGGANSLAAKGLRLGGGIWREAAPSLFALVAFLSGAMTLLSAATPESAQRLRWLSELAPLGLIEASHFLSSLTGVVLLFLAFGLRDRSRPAWRATLVLLVVTAAACLLKGLGAPEAVFLAVATALLAANGRAFDRGEPLSRAAISPAGLAAVAGVLIAAAAVGLFAYKDVAYQDDLWWTFVLHGDAPRFLRAGVGAVVVALLILGWRLSRPRPPRVTAPTAADMARAGEILAVAEDASPNAELVFLGDKSILFTDDGSSFVAYGVRGRNCIAMGEPVGPRAARREAVWAFREFCDRNGATPVFYAVRRESLSDFIDCGLAATKVGETARVDLESFNLEGKVRAPLRHAINRGRRDGAVFEVVPAEGFDAIAPTLRALSDEWLAIHQGVEKGFSLGRFDEAYLRRFPTAVLKVEDRIVAFANLWRTPDGRVLSIDLMRYGAEAPRNSMDILFIELIAWGQANGFSTFDLGMAPLSGLESHRLSPLVGRVGGFVYNEGGGLYGFEGLRAFKEKFSPRWEGVYIAAPSGWMLGPALADAALLSSGGILGALR
ncbi:bifunctional lysylphosphatidylglycerol flippase/synthetase MprF [Brevundimonas staleyi]|uniref:Bifunctional lysylphosphatidylglycerol flippase/synthetase MprF n=1 Tax=Brevundimonas staleyi TaxID=74326 RepID=A0ABW0FX77_9CAUL